MLTAAGGGGDDSGFLDLPPEVLRPFSLLLFSQFVLLVGVGCCIPVLPIYGKSIGLSGGLNGIVISAPALALLIGAAPAGRYADAARKPAMLLGMAVIVVSDVGTALSTSLAPLLAARLGLGAGRIISESGERGMLADIANQAPSLRGRALALQQATIALGIAVGAPLGGLAVEQYGARAAFLCVSAGATITLLLYTLLPETINAAQPATPARGRPKRSGGATADKPDEASPISRWVALLSDSRWRGLCAAEMGARFGGAAKIACIPLLAASTFEGGATAAGLLVSAAGLAGLVGAPVGGWLTDRKGARFSAMSSGVTSGVALLCVPLALERAQSSTDEAAVAFGGAVLLWAVGAAAQGPSLTAYAQELAPRGAEAESLALPRAAGDGTFIAAPFLLGLVADALPATPGAECAVAGGATLIGVAVLSLLAAEGEAAAAGRK